MAKEIWRVLYDITKVNGEKYPKEPEMIRYHEENIVRTLKEGAEKLADRYDFAIVAVKAQSMNDPKKKYEYTHRAETGLNSDWIVGR